MRKTFSISLTAFLVAAMMLTAFGCGKTKDGDANKVKESAKPTAESTVTPTDSNNQSDPGETVATIAVEDTTAKKGKKFKVPVTIDVTDKGGYCAFEFSVNFDASLVKLLNVSTTDVTKDMLNMSNLEFEKGLAKIGYASGLTLEENGAICELEFEALKSGEFDLEITDAFVYRFVTVDGTETSASIGVAITPSKVTID